ARPSGISRSLEPAPRGRAPSTETAIPSGLPCPPSSPEARKLLLAWVAVAGRALGLAVTAVTWDRPRHSRGRPCTRTHPAALLQTHRVWQPAPNAYDRNQTATTATWWSPSHPDTLAQAPGPAPWPPL